MKENNGTLVEKNDPQNHHQNDDDTLRTLSVTYKGEASMKVNTARPSHE